MKPAALTESVELSVKFALQITSLVHNFKQFNATIHSRTLVKSGLDGGKEERTKVKEEACSGQKGLKHGDVRTKWNKVTVGPYDMELETN